MNLLILNYSMRPESILFSHQREIAVRLSGRFKSTFVITSDGNRENINNNLFVLSTHWKVRKSFINALNFYRIVLPILFKNRGNLVVFSHMTEVQSLLISPFCAILRIKHFLWYAHKSKSPYLRFSFPLLSGVITSTSGSCPLSGPKVHAIGQAIDTKLFSSAKNPPKNPPLRWYHIGRLDESKNIHLIIEAFQKLRGLGWDLSLDLYGEPSMGRTSNYFQSLLKYFSLEETAGWLRYHGSINRSQIPEVAQNHDGFIHAFEGSLDKALLEAIMCRRVVVSTNTEFLLEFESTNYAKKKNLYEVIQQMEYSLKLSSSEQAKRVDRYWQIATLNHSLESWIEKLSKVLILK